MNGKLLAYFHETFPAHFTRGKQTAAEFLKRNGWEPQAPQQGQPAYKCPVTKSNYLEPEALRRQEQRPIEDQVPIMVSLLAKENAEAKNAIEAKDREFSACNQERLQLLESTKRLEVRIEELSKPKAPEPPQPVAAGAAAPGTVVKS